MAVGDGSRPPIAEGGDDDDTGPRRSGSTNAPRGQGASRARPPVFLNVGRKHLVTPADIVGKIAGVTRLPATVVGAIDIHQRHVLVDVDAEHAALIVKKLAGIRLKGEALAPALAGAEPKLNSRSRRGLAATHRSVIAGRFLRFLPSPSS